MSQEYVKHKTAAAALKTLAAVILLLLSPGCGLNSGHKREITRHYTDFTFTRIKQARNPQETISAIYYIDSVYAAFPYISIADRCKYYMVMSYTVIDSLGKKGRGMRYIDSSIALLERNNLTEELNQEYTSALLMKGSLLLQQERYAEAYHYYSRGAALAYRHGNNCAAGNFEAVLGSIYFRQNRFREAAASYSKAIRVLEWCGDPNTRYIQLSGNKSNLALAYLRMGMADSALHYGMAAINFLLAYPELKHNNNRHAEQSLGVLYGNMAQAYMLKNESDTAEYWYKQSIAINDREGYEINDATVTMLHLAELYIRQHKMEAADSLLRLTWTRLDGKNSHIKLLWLEEHWHLEQLLRPGDALQDELNYYRYKDSIAEQQKPFQSSSFMHAFAEAEKNLQIAQIRQDSETRRLMMLIAIVASVLLAVIAAIVLVSLYKTRRLMREMTRLSEELVARKEQKRKEDLILQEMELQLANQNNLIRQRTKISDDMHDDLSASLIALKFFVDDARRKADSQLSAALLTHIAEELAAVYEDARNYISNLRTQAHTQAYNLTQYLLDMGKKFEAHTSLRIYSDVNEVQLQEFLDIHQNEHLYHIVKEGLSNMIKHSGATAARIIIRFDEDLCYFVIEDNGKGFDTNEAGKGQGLQSIRTRVQQLGGTLEIDFCPEGTRIRGQFPLSGK